MSAFLVITIGESTHTLLLDWAGLVALGVVILAGVCILMAFGYLLALHRTPTQSTRPQVSRHIRR